MCRRVKIVLKQKKVKIVLEQKKLKTARAHDSRHTKIGSTAWSREDRRQRGRKRVVVEGDDIFS